MNSEIRKMAESLQSDLLDFCARLIETRSDSGDEEKIARLIADELEKLGYTFVSAEIEMVPSTYTKLEDEETATKMQKMLDMFEDNDDIQNVWHNWEMD